jgi:hypothetical protein
VGDPNQPRRVPRHGIRFRNRLKVGVFVPEVLAAAMDDKQASSLMPNSRLLPEIAARSRLCPRIPAREMTGHIAGRPLAAGSGRG